MDKSLSASKAGFPCMRHLWYSVNGFGNGDTDTHTQRIFDVGTALEPVAVEWLKSDGWNVEYNPGSQNAAIQVNIPIKGGSLTGHPDCIISKGDIHNCLVDIKTMNDRAFTFWRREGTLKSKSQYVIQLHIYALGLILMGRDISRLGIVGINKNNSDMHIDFFDYDPIKAQEIVSYTEWLFQQEEALDTGCPTEDWACNYCEYSDKCTLSKAHQSGQSKTLAPQQSTDSLIIIDAMKELKQARDMAKEAKDMEAHAKSVLDENVRAKGLSGIQGGGFVFTMSERTSSRWDSVAFKRAYPELVSQFTKTSTCITYNIREASA